MRGVATRSSIAASLLAGMFTGFPPLPLSAASAASAGSVASEASGASEAPVPAELDRTAEQLLDRALRNLYAEDYIQTLVLATQSRGGREMRRRLQILRRQSVRPGKALLRFLYPQDIRRTSVLILENENASDDLYVYLPAVRLTRHLSSAQRADAFFGTDLTYEDVEPKHIEDYRARWLSEEEREALEVGSDADACRLMEVTAAPGFESGYERQISCIEPERAIIAWTDFYAKGQILKRLTIDPSKVKPVGDRHIPFLITIETPRRRSATRVVTEDYDLRAKIPDRLFNTWNLEAGDAKSDRAKTRAAVSVASPGGASEVHTGDEVHSGE
jgi:hypothetical protein